MQRSHRLLCPMHQTAFDIFISILIVHIADILEPVGRNEKSLSSHPSHSTCLRLSVVLYHHSLHHGMLLFCRNVIMWMDHRAVEEAKYINETNHQLLKFVGGKISLEMEMPKILWLKKVW